MSDPDPPLSLEQLAGISAALAEQLPLADVLAQEQVDEAAFRKAKAIWTPRIVESVVTQLEYTEKYRIAQDCLARKLSPIEDDPSAWVGLLGGLATSLDQNEMLAKLGVTMNDVGRLGRVWKRRISSDPELGNRLAELAKTAGPPQKVTAGRIELRPFPWTPKTKAEAPKPPPPEPVNEPEAPEEAPQVQRVLASFQVAVAVKGERGREDDVFSQWSIERYARLAWELRQQPADADGVMQRAGLLTPESRRAVHEHFRRRFDGEPGLRAQFDALLAAAAPKSPRAPAGSGTEEIDLAAVLRRRRPTTPFQRPTDGEPAVARRKEQEAADQALAKHATGDAAVIARMKAAFKGVPVSGSTELVDPNQVRPALPFSPARGSTAPPAAEAAKRPLEQTADMPPPLGWTLARYARFCVELSLSGLPEPQVLDKARLTPQTRQLLDSYWQPRLQAEPTLRSEWQHHVNTRAAELRRR